MSGDVATTFGLTDGTSMVYTGGMPAIAKPTIPTPAPGTCGCGCGEAVKKRFRPGHDARLKSTLLNVARLGDSRQAERAAWTMVESGWSRFVDDEILLALPQRNRRGARLIPIERVETWLMEPTIAPGSCHGVCHCNAACPALTRAAKVAGQTHPLTKLARPGWVRRAPATDENRAHVAMSWDLCTECTQTDTVLDQCERLWFRTTIGITALEAETGADVLTPAAIALRNIGLVVAPDVDDQGQPYPTGNWAADAA